MRAKQKEREVSALRLIYPGDAGFTRLESIRNQMLLSSAIAVLRGLLLFIIYWLDHPFGHQVGVTPAPFDYSIQVFDAVDQGT
jgi:hypothetical protein